MPDESRPLIVHADWGSAPKKRWMCVAEPWPDGGYRIIAPEPVGDPCTLLERLRDRAEGRALAVGFDFPIGLPASYARRAGIEQFLEVLPQLGHGAWGDFYTVASTPEDVSLSRPFYPMRPGGTRRRHLTDALGVAELDDLLRLCEQPSESRGAASPLFWTLGGKQVGKAAIIGWRDVIGPAVRDGTLSVSVWPFDGDFADLLTGGGVVIVETYPAEACLHIGLEPPGRTWSKTRREGRLGQAEGIKAWAEARPVEMADELRELIADGFGSAKHGEDPFDAMLGVLSMVEVVLGYRLAGAPRTADVRHLEGWILGQAPSTIGRRVTAGRTHPPRGSDSRIGNSTVSTAGP